MNGSDKLYKDSLSLIGRRVSRNLHWRSLDFNFWASRVSWDSSMIQSLWVGIHWNNIWKYYSCLDCKFYVNYAATLENICKTSKKVTELPYFYKVPFQRILVNLPNQTINFYLHGQDFMPPISTQIFFKRWLVDKKNILR